MTARIWQPVPDEPCGNTAAHLAHRNWRGAECGVCPGVPAATAEPSRRPAVAASPERGPAGGAR